MWNLSYSYNVAHIPKRRTCKFSIFRKCYYLIQFWTNILCQTLKCCINYCMSVLEIIANKKNKWYRIFVQNWVRKWLSRKITHSWFWLHQMLNFWLFTKDLVVLPIEEMPKVLIIVFDFCFRRVFKNLEISNSRFKPSWSNNGFERTIWLYGKNLLDLWAWPYFRVVCRNLYCWYQEKQNLTLLSIFGGWIGCEMSLMDRRCCWSSSLGHWLF